MQIFVQNAMSEMDNEVQWEQTNEVQLLFRENGSVCVCVCGEWKSKLLLHSLVRRMYAPQFFASSQQRFGVTDIKAPSVCHSSRVLDRPCYSSQVSNGPCYSS